MKTNSLPKASFDLGIGNQLKDLAELVGKWTDGLDGAHQTDIPGLRFSRFSNTTEPDFYIQETAVCFILQGRKHVSFGKETYVYDPSTCLVASVDLPVSAFITDATKEKPYLGIVLSIEPKDLATLIIETGKQPVRRDEGNEQALSLTRVTASLAEPFMRLVKLLDTPEEISILAPMIIREIYFRLLQTEQFGILSQLAVGDGKLRRVSHAISWIKQNLASPLKIEELAKQVNMSESGLHHQFKEVTSFSPLQFQKRLRLQRARQILLSDKTSIEKVAYQIGYESPTQFSREYARLFGQPPLRDINKCENPVAQIRNKTKSLCFYVR